MAHWDDSGTAVGYEGEEVDKLIKQQFCNHNYLSTCCGFPAYHPDIDICSSCKEHTDFECGCGRVK